MAGIWDRVRNRGEMDNPVPSLLVHAAVNLVVNDVFTAVQARDAINATLQVPLSQEEITDLQNIITQAGLGDDRAKAQYINMFHSLMIAVEMGALTNEATFRSKLGLV